MFEKDYIVSDRYRIIELIGEGGMANVYLAFDLILKRNVAIKVLRGDLSEGDMFVKRFRREALAATALNHPNIVQVYDIGEEAGRYFIVMEYVKGINLKQLVSKRKHLSVSEVIDISKQLTQALDHAHSKQVVHRDIKPHNVLIQQDGTIKITDFGIAVTLNATLLTQTNSILGSVHYLPPEQISGNVANAQSDIYSIGILMYELVTGELPFSGDSAVTIALMHVRDKVPRPRDIDITIPQSLENVIIRATAKNPANRFSSVREMYEAIVVCEGNPNVSRLKLNDSLEQDVMNTLLNKSTDIIHEEEEEDKYQNIKILGAIISIIIITSLIIILLIPKVSETQTVKVPDVVGMNVNEAKSKLVNSGINVSTEIKYVYTDQEKDADENIKFDDVIQTDPEAGSKVSKGVSVILTVSKGQNNITLASYVGEDIDETKKALEKMGLIVSIVEEEAKDKVSTSVVTSQSPDAGSKVYPGDVIILRRAKQINKYPDMVGEGYTKEEAEKFCFDYNIKCTFKYEESDAEIGTVASQSIEAGSLVSQGDDFEISLSRGNGTNNGND